MQGMMKPNTGISLASIGLALALCAGGLESVHADWTVINLHPTGLANSEAHAIYGAQQVGVTGTSQGALLWTGSAGSVVKLDGTTAVGVANGVWDGRQGGSVSVGTGVNRRTHAAIWSGTQASMVDLHPGASVAVHSMIMAMDGTQQVGSFLSAASGGGGATFSTGVPCLWNGTAGSFVDLTPAGYTTGEARGCFGGQQVGATFDNGLGTACMWYGTAESFVNLQPEEALFSAAQCTDGVHQYGVIGILEPITGLFPVRWSGTAESWELLNIPDTDTQWGEVHACFNGYAVGYLTDTDGISNSRACAWTDGPDSYVDLQQYLAAPLNESNALGVRRHEASGTTYVVGWALNTSNNQRRAVMWVDSQGTNLIVSPSAPVDNSASAGQSMAYNVHIVNAGPVASGPVTLTVTLPAPWLATFAGATPAPAAPPATAQRSRSRPSPALAARRTWRSPSPPPAAASRRSSPPPMPRPRSTRRTTPPPLRRASPAPRPASPTWACRVVCPGTMASSTTTTSSPSSATSSTPTPRPTWAARAALWAPTARSTTTTSSRSSRSSSPAARKR
ncbi:MAG: hypothetical protein QM783_02900 [Phycisphaerales bacterium]